MIIDVYKAGAYGHMVGVPVTDPHDRQDDSSCVGSRPPPSSSLGMLLHSTKSRLNSLKLLSIKERPHVTDAPADQDVRMGGLWLINPIAAAVRVLLPFVFRVFSGSRPDCPRTSPRVRFRR